MSVPSGPESPSEAPTCYRHPDRHTYVRCTRCQRFICPECMRAAAVGHQCVECVRAGARTVRRPRTHFAGRHRFTTAVVTYALIAVNVLMFVLHTASPDLGRQLTLWSPAVAEGDLYRLLTSAFMHYGLTHLLLNMLALFVVGPPLEMWLGRLRFGALYALSALGGSVLVYLLSPLNAATAGASGAVFGLFGAAFVVAKRLKLDVRGVVVLIVINLVFTFVVPAVSSQSISWQGHVGGLVTGALVASAYVYAPRNHRNMIQAGVTVAVVVLFAVLICWRTSDLLAEFGRQLGLGEGNWVFPDAPQALGMSRAPRAMIVSKLPDDISRPYQDLTPTDTARPGRADLLDEKGLLGGCHEFLKRQHEEMGELRCGCRAQSRVSIGGLPIRWHAGSWD